MKNGYSWCTDKVVLWTFCNIFKMIYSHVESLHNASPFYSNSKQFWAVQDSFVIVEKLMIKINHKNYAKIISTFNFSARYHNFLINVLNEIISIVSLAVKRKHELGFQNHRHIGHPKELTNNFFIQQSLRHAVSFFVKNYFFTIGNLVFKKCIGISVGIDPALFGQICFFISLNRSMLKT